MVWKSGVWLPDESMNPQIAMCGSETLRALAGWPSPTKNPVITETGLDILRYICSDWFDRFC